MTRERRYSLLYVQFAVMVVLATVIYIVVQLRDSGYLGAVPLEDLESISPVHLLIEYRYALIMIVTTSAAIWVSLNFALRPLRRLSQLAGAIGPANLHERLPLEKAPVEIAPLVSAFNSSLDRLEAAWAAQRAFSANAAHELRTPLGALRAEVESRLPAAERQAATLEFERLARVIEQLLILAEADQEHLNHQGRFDLVAVVRDTAMEMAPNIILHGRDIDFHTDHETLGCNGDPILVGIAIRNLIENAVRHTPVGTCIRIRIPEGGRVIVEDTGAGVPKAFEDHLFERFSKSDTNSYGAGLGLSIVARIMALHGGRVFYERLSSGSAFHMVFPEANDQLATPVVPQP